MPLSEPAVPLNTHQRRLPNLATHRAERCDDHYRQASGAKGVNWASSRCFIGLDLFLDLPLGLGSYAPASIRSSLPLSTPLMAQTRVVIHVAAGQTSLDGDA